MLGIYKKHILRETPMFYFGGGGKSGGGATDRAAPMITETGGTNELEASAKTAEGTDTIDTEKAVDKKRMGTRGLQIPMNSTQSAATAATTGVQV